MKLKLKKTNVELVLTILVNIPIKNPVYAKIRDVLVKHIQILDQKGVIYD